MGKKFRERNLIVIAAISAVIIVLAAFLVLDYSRIPLLSGQKTYSADFETSVGLDTGDVVTVAGIRVGSITGISLDGNAAKVKFSIRKGIHLGSDTSAAAKVLDPVGVEYVELDPSGPGRLTGTIPVSRTSIPSTLISDLNQLTVQTQQINIPQLVKSLNVVTQTFDATTPAQTKAALDGVASLSAVLAGRQAELDDLVAQSDKLATELNQHNAQLVGLLGQSNLILTVLEQRKAAIDNILKTTTTLTTQIDHIISGDRSVLDPLLSNLQAVSASLANDSSSLGQAIPLLAAFSRYAANIAGSGPYVDTVDPTAVIPDNLIDQCAKFAANNGTSSLLGCRP